MSFQHIQLLSAVEDADTIAHYQSELAGYSSIVKSDDWKWTMAEGELNEFASATLESKYALFLKVCSDARIEIQAHEVTKDLLALFALLCRLNSEPAFIRMDKTGAVDSQLAAHAYVSEQEIRLTITFYREMVHKHGGEMGFNFWSAFLVENMQTFDELPGDEVIARYAKDLASCTHTTPTVMHAHAGTSAAELFSKHAGMTDDIKSALGAMSSSIIMGSPNPHDVTLPAIGQLTNTVAEIANYECADKSSEQVFADWLRLSADVKKHRQTILSPGSIFTEESLDKKLGAMLDLHETEPARCTADCPWTGHSQGLPSSHLCSPTRSPPSTSSGESPTTSVSASTVVTVDEFAASSSSSPSLPATAPKTPAAVAASEPVVDDSLYSPATTAAVVLQSMAKKRSIAQQAQDNARNLARATNELLAYIAEKSKDIAADAEELVRRGALVLDDKVPECFSEYLLLDCNDEVTDKVRANDACEFTSLRIGAHTKKRVVFIQLALERDDDGSVRRPVALLQKRPKKLDDVAKFIGRFSKKSSAIKKRADKKRRRAVEVDKQQEVPRVKRQTVVGAVVGRGKSIRCTDMPCAIPGCSRTAWGGCLNKDCALSGRTDVGVCKTHMHTCNSTDRDGPCQTDGCAHCLYYSQGEWTCSTHWRRCFARGELKRDPQVAPNDSAQRRANPDTNVVYCKNSACLYKKRRRSTGHYLEQGDEKTCDNCGDVKTCITCSEVFKFGNHYYYFCSEQCGDDFDFPTTTSSVTPIERTVDTDIQQEPAVLPPPMPILPTPAVVATVPSTISLGGPAMKSPVMTFDQFKKRVDVVSDDDLEPTPADFTGLGFLDAFSDDFCPATCGGDNNFGIMSDD